MAGRCIDRIVLVDEECIKKAVVMLMTKEKLVVEPSGAVGIAALITYPELVKGRNAAVVITGRNLDERLFKPLVEEFS
ncbi:MAG: hypothetical protein AB1420_15090 [Bacillota bacterium]